MTPARRRVSAEERSPASPSSPHPFSLSLWMLVPSAPGRWREYRLSREGESATSAESAPSALGFQAVVPIEGLALYRDDCDSLRRSRSSGHASTAPLRGGARNDSRYRASRRGSAGRPPRVGPAGAAQAPAPP